MVSHNRGARGAHYRDIHSTKLLKGQERKQRKLAEHYQGLDEKKEKVYTFESRNTFDSLKDWVPAPNVSKLKYLPRRVLRGGRLRWDV